MDDNAGGAIYLFMMKVRDNKRNGNAFNVVLSLSLNCQQIFLF